MITPPGKPLTVAIADDHTLMRSALVSLIVSGNNNYKVCIHYSGRSYGPMGRAGSRFTTPKDRENGHGITIGLFL